MHLLWPLACLAVLATVASHPFAKDGSGACTEAADCPTNCTLTECFCSGKETKVDQTKPQIVYLTFDDALSELASTQFYEEIFGTPTNHTLSNPNGCALRATHYVTHSYTDYSLVNRWWHYGHEIASHSMTHRNNLTYWQQMDETEWAAEMVGMRKSVAQFANIPACEVSGMRSPFLQGGGDTMYSMLEHNNFRYDCTWPTRKFGYTDAMQGLYPYTLDYKSVQDCPIEPCPKCSHPGVWVQPMIDLEDEWLEADPTTDYGMPCSMLDACTIIPNDQFPEEMDSDQVYHMLMKNFNRIYNGSMSDFGEWQEGNRAPWGLYMHAAWFFGDNYWHFEGYKKFITEIASYPDTWIVPVSSGIDYMEAEFLGKSYSNEALTASGKTDGPFACQDIEEKTGKYDSAKNRCGPKKSCRFPKVNEPEDGILNQERYMAMCSYNGNAGDRQNCPDEERYPWLGDPCSNNLPCGDCVP